MQTKEHTAILPHSHYHQIPSHLIQFYPKKTSQHVSFFVPQAGGETVSDVVLTKPSDGT